MNEIVPFHGSTRYECVQMSKNIAEVITRTVMVLALISLDQLKSLLSYKNKR